MTEVLPGDDLFAVGDPSDPAEELAAGVIAEAGDGTTAGTRSPSTTFASLRHRNFLVFWVAAIISNSGGDTNVLIENNLLAGGGWTLYCESGGTGTNYRVINNRFSRKFGPKVGYFGPSTECSDETQSGNVYHETGRPLRLQ